MDEDNEACLHSPLMLLRWFFHKGTSHPNQSPGSYYSQGPLLQCFSQYHGHLLSLLPTLLSLHVKTKQSIRSCVKRIKTGKVEWKNTHHLGVLGLIFQFIFLHEWNEMIDSLLHYTGWLDHLWQEHLPRSKQVSHNGHSFHQWPLNYIQWSGVFVHLLPSFFCVLLNILVDTLGVRQCLRVEHILVIVLSNKISIPWWGNTQASLQQEHFSSHGPLLLFSLQSSSAGQIQGGTQ